MTSHRIACLAMTITSALPACATHTNVEHGSEDYQITQPTLIWQPYPSQLDISNDRQGKLKSVRAVTYELIVYSADRQVVYSRLSLPAPKHRIEVPLPAGETFYWTSRAHFKIGGKDRVSRWNSSSWSIPLQWRLPVPLSDYSWFRT
jgi:hypothetical protein